MVKLKHPLLINNDLKLKKLKSISIKEGLSFTNSTSQVMYRCIVLVYCDSII